MKLLTYIILLVTLSMYLPEGMGQTIPVYEHFSDLQPLFEKSSDTTYVVNFWATWCAPCVKEMPGFQALNQKYKKEKFKMILVSLDFENQINSKVIPFIQERGIEAEVVVLADSRQHLWIDKVNPEWSGSIPITLIYNKDFSYFHEGTLTYEELDELITKNIIQ